MDNNAARLEFCKTGLGVPYIIHAGETDIMEQLAEITHGDMPTVVIDASGNREAINQGLQLSCARREIYFGGIAKRGNNVQSP